MAFAVVDLGGTIRGYLPWRPEGTVTPDVSPDGKRVAFAIVKGTVSQIATMRMDRTGLRVITDDPVSAIRPRWSPDGSQLLFFREGRDGDPSPHGHERRRLERTSDPGYAHSGREPARLVAGWLLDPLHIHRERGRHRHGAGDRWAIP